MRTGLIEGFPSEVKELVILMTIELLWHHSPMGETGEDWVVLGIYLESSACFLGAQAWESVKTPEVSESMELKGRKLKEHFLHT